MDDQHKEPTGVILRLEFFPEPAESVGRPAIQSRTRYGGLRVAGPGPVRPPRAGRSENQLQQYRRAR